MLITVGLNQGNQIKHLGLHYCYINCSLALPKTKGLFSAIAANQNQIEPRALPLSKTKQKPSHTRKYSPLHCPKCISWVVPRVSHSFPQPQSPPYANWKRRPPDRLFDGFIKKTYFLSSITLFRGALWGVPGIPLGEDTALFSQNCSSKSPESLKMHTGWQQAEFYALLGASLEESKQYGNNRPVNSAPRVQCWGSGQLKNPRLRNIWANERGQLTSRLKGCHEGSSLTHNRSHFHILWSLSVGSSVHVLLDLVVHITSLPSLLPIRYPVPTVSFLHG